MRLACFPLLLLLLVVADAIQNTRPHILMILSDDFGWADAGWHRPDGYEEISTPAMTALAKEGLNLNRHYAFKYCSPSRSALQSGCNPIHVNVMNTDPGYSNPDDPVSGFSGIPRNMTGIASVMKSAGYRTHMVGKWDVGMATMDHTPHGRGYESSLGYFYHTNDYWNFTVDDDFGAGPKSCASLEEGESIVDLWTKEFESDYEGPAIGLNNSIPKCFSGNEAQPPHELVGNCKYEDMLFEERVISIIDKHNTSDVNSPLFLFYSPHIVHEPLQVPQFWLDKFAFIKDDENRRRYHAMVNFMDGAIGNITDKLKERDMWDNTLVVFSADNGGAIYRNGTAGGNNFPHRGGKASNFEGGIRVNAFVSGGFLPDSVRGSTLEGLIALWDWYATFASLAGADPTDHRAAAAGLPGLDSIDVSDYILGRSKLSPRKDLLVGAPSGFHDIWGGDYPVGAQVNGIIVDEGDAGLWKLLVGGVGMDIWTGPRYPNASMQWTSHNSPEQLFLECGEACLWRLDIDPCEHNDLSQDPGNAVRLQRMKALAEAGNKTSFSPNRGKKNALACSTAQNKWQNFWGPFLP